MAKLEDYYIGLDCGTASVGWAVTDENYNIPKVRGERLHGVRLFETANTAAKRRGYRASRRRNQRAKNRIKLLNMLFHDEIYQVDPDFYTRLRESFYLEDDKQGLKSPSKNTLFNDQDYHDKDFHKAYPTIWHLRQAIMNNPDQHFDIRLYYLAIHHILKHRGHFLYPGKFSINNNFSDIFQELVDLAEAQGLYIDEMSADNVEKIITDASLTKTDKKKQLQNIMSIERDDEDDKETGKKQKQALAAMLVGLKANYGALFKIESEEQKTHAFSDSNFEDKLATEIEQLVGLENIEIILAAKRVYDYAILKNLLGDSSTISDAMVGNYDQHKKDLEELKTLLRPFKKDYEAFFKAEVFSEKFPSYNAYIGKAYTKNKDGRRKTKHVDQEVLNKHIVKLLEKHKITGDIFKHAQRGELLPKQKGQAKGTIPQQLHHEELKLILEHLAKDYPSFAKQSSEPEEYNTKCKKILSIHSFRIPYYCGPLPKRKFDDKGNEVAGGKSQFSWGDEEINQIVYPWNFNEVVDLDARANNFIRRMTNDCTYLVGEPVLPKASLLYQKYLILNELNNLKLNGKRITDVKMKQKIYEDAFLQDGLIGNVRLKGLKKWLVENGYIQASDELGGTNDVKVLPKLSTHRDFVKILGEDYAKKYNSAKLEEVIEAITVLGDEKEMLRRKIQQILGCDDTAAQNLAKLSYKDWGKFSAKFLTGIKAPVNGVELNILDALYQSNNNLMELRGGEYDFKKRVDEYNSALNQKSGAKLTYADVKDLYCSPAVKRTIWQAIKIVNELVKVIGHPPKKIFLEVTRENEDANTKNRNAFSRLKRKEQLLELYLHLKDRPEELINQLNLQKDRDLQSKKLFLYYTQMGRCAYSGERINLEDLHTSAYDIDHIYPRSLTKDDSITRNLVLVKAEYNRDKTNGYPINPDWQERMKGTWRAWQAAGLITKEKYDRLVRSERLTPEELGGFIARQLVETSQSVKAIGQLLSRAYPESKIITVKAGQVSAFRDLFSNDQKDRDSGKVIKPGLPEFIKVRELNDYHHAKDAYLNIVVGNVMSSTFTDDPYQWVKNREGKEYSINPKVLFRDKETYRARDGRTACYPEVKGWDFQKSIDIVSETIKRNDILLTRMTNKKIAGILYNATILGKSEKNKDLVPLKHGVRGNIKKYGGYSSMETAYFALVLIHKGAGKEPRRRIASIPTMFFDDPESYIATKKEYENGKIILIIPKYALIKIEGFPLYIAGKDSDTSIEFNSALQLLLQPEDLPYLKKVLKVRQKVVAEKGKYPINKWDNVTKKVNIELFDKMMDKMLLLKKMNGTKGKVDEIIKSRKKFLELDIANQCVVIGNLLDVFGMKTNGDLSLFVSGAKKVGRARYSDNLDNYEKVELILQSPTGIYEKKLNLKEIE